MLIQRPKNSNIKILRKKKEVCRGINQMHAIQWSSSNFLFKTYKRMCSKAEKRNYGSFQVNFLATNKTLNYLIPTLRLLKNVGSEPKLEIILAENYRVTNITLVNIARSLRYIKEMRSLVIDLAR